MLKHRYLIVIAALAFTLFGCTGATGTALNNTGQLVDSEASSSAAQNDFNIKDKVQVGDYVVQALNIQTHTATNQFLKPKAGNKYVAVEVLYENRGANETLSYNPLDWTLYDEEGYSYTSGFADNKEPDLSYGDLNPGKKVRGWVTFEVKKTSKQFTIQFKPDLFSNDNVEIRLY